MMNVPLRIVLRSLFGTHLAEHMRIVEPALEAIMASSTGFNSIAFFLRIPTPKRKQHFLGVEKLNKVVYELIARGREKLNNAESGSQTAAAQIGAAQASVAQ